MNIFVCPKCCGDGFVIATVTTIRQECNICEGSGRVFITPAIKSESFDQLVGV